ncbi:MAG: FAD-dependent oxidoreductase [Pseudazoarcus pumilus]|nr:FAD-dependent oxidoreductase [Pseudazoarcus pumilus]
MDMGELSRVGSGERRIAVVGSGIAGLASAWLLARKARVTLFEAGSYFGGHTNTVDVELDGQAFGVDTGFLVFNERTYPNLCALFQRLDVPVAQSDMSFSVSLRSPDVEWAGSDLGTVFAQRRNLVRPAMWRMLADILRFNRAATAMATGGSAPDMSLGEYLDASHYSTMFRDWYLLPMAAAIWSCPTQAMLAYPLATFVRFCHNHGLVQILDRPQWMTVRGGAREYVRRMLPAIQDARLNTPVERVTRDETGVWVRARGAQERFDEVVFACHTDQTLAILGDDATADERRLLGAVRYQRNRAVLHTDPALLPRRRKVWSAWNYLSDRGQDGERSVSVSYLLNQLQPLPCSTPVVVSLNPFEDPRESHCLAEFDYAHPVFDHAAVAAQAQLPAIQGVRHSWFAGAWSGYGFHEDGLKSALRVAESLGVAAPWMSRQVRPMVTT